MKCLWTNKVVVKLLDAQRLDDVGDELRVHVHALDLGVQQLAHVALKSTSDGKLRERSRTSNFGEIFCGL